MYPLVQSTAITIPIFVHDAAGEAVTGLLDGGFTKRIDKNGAGFGAMTVTITEMENGFYSLPLSASHTDTLGLLTMVFTSTAKQVNIQLRVGGAGVLLDEQISDTVHDDAGTVGALLNDLLAVVAGDIEHHELSGPQVDYRLPGVVGLRFRHSFTRDQTDATDPFSKWTRS